MFFNNLFNKIKKYKYRNYRSIILMVDGGFCSQLNKYFFGKLLEDKLGVKVKYCLSWFETDGKSTDGQNSRNFDLLKVYSDINFPIATSEEVKLYKKNFYYYNEKFFLYDEALFQKKPPLYIDGYFGHWRYLKETEEKGYSNIKFKLDLSNQNQLNLEKINEAESSVAVHIRRGDYVGSVHDVLTKDYFINAINYLKLHLSPLNPHFFIFSNGIDWVKKEIIPELSSDINYEFIENNNEEAGYYDFYLLSQCKHQIVSNSFFGYLGAFLNKNREKKVIIPKNWIKTESNDLDISMHYPGWIVMNNEGVVF